MLARDRAAFGEHVATFWPDLDALRTVHDRLELVAAADAAGVATPETRPLSSVERFDRRSVVKSRYAILTDAYHDGTPPERCVEPSGVHYVVPGRDVDGSALREAFGHDPIVQAYVPGEEFSF